MTDTERLLSFMEDLAKHEPSTPVTYSELIHTIHLTIGTVAEALKSSYQNTVEETTDGK